jgi:hypothetical protein
MKADAKPTFEDVARAIAQDDPPEWLVPALDFFSGYIGSERMTKKDHDWVWKHSEQMRWAADALIKDLQRIFKGLSSSDVTTAIKVLTKVRNFYRERPRTGGGHILYGQRLTCAAVVVEAWKLLHDGSVEPQSIEVLSACADYWQACDGAERDAKNWRRDTEHALAEPDQFVQQGLASYLVAYAHN